MRRKSFIQTILATGVGVAVCAVCTTPAMALEATSASFIPDQMAPYSKIIFSDATHYEILSGGNANAPASIDVGPFDTEESSLMTESVADGSSVSAPTEALPQSTKGTEVTYGSDGGIVEINGALDQPASESAPGILTRASSKGTLIARWGRHNNRLYRKGNIYIGYGRATTYADTFGQSDHRLKKGDVSVQKYYDNCKVGTVVKVTAKVKWSSAKRTIKMKKWDKGDLPDAIVDIWKSCVSYWGYKYNSNLSLPGTTKIEHRA